MGSFSDPALILPGAVSNTEVSATAAIAGTKLEAGWQKNTASGIVGIDADRRINHLISKAASANIRNSHDAEAFKSGAVGVYEKMKTIILDFGLRGSARFLFDLKSGNGIDSVNAKVYRNGVALGSFQTTTSGSYVTMSEDITQEWAAGDACQFYAANSFGNNIYVRNFRIAYDDSPNVTVPSTNTTP